MNLKESSNNNNHNLQKEMPWVDTKKNKKEEKYNIIVESKFYKRRVP